MCKQVHPLGFTSLLALILVACTITPSITPSVVSPTSAASPTSIPTPLPPPPTEPPVVIAYIKDGNIKLLEETSDQVQTIFTAGDVTSVTMSDDGQVIAFTRALVVELTGGYWYEQFALWAVDRNGENPRQLVSFEELRGHLDVEERDSSNFLQIEWIPGTHRLLFSGTKYLVQGEGLSHAYPQGVYLVDTETGSISVLVSADQNLRFISSPDGEQIALISLTELSFFNTDGSNWRRDILTYPDMSVTAPVFPNGVWTQDASAFLITGPIESDARYVLNFTLWRVPVDGSPAEPLATILDSHPASVTFSPNGHGAAYYRGPEQDWSIIPLAVDVGLVAISRHIDLGYANLHWSPAGDAFAIHGGTLARLCPDGLHDTDVCEDHVQIEGMISTIRWIDETRFLFMTRDPDALYLGGLDGTTISIVTWQPGDAGGAQSFTTISITP